MTESPEVKEWKERNNGVPLKITTLKAGVIYIFQIDGRKVRCMSQRMYLIRRKLGKLPYAKKMKPHFPSAEMGKGAGFSDYPELTYRQVAEALKKQNSHG